MDFSPISPCNLRCTLVWKAPDGMHLFVACMGVFCVAHTHLVYGAMYLKRVQLRL
jgi:hypothetical protein